MQKFSFSSQHYEPRSFTFILSFTNWNAHSGEPNGNGPCMEMQRIPSDSGKLWNDSPCTQDKIVVCELAM